MSCANTVFLWVKISFLWHIVCKIPGQCLANAHEHSQRSHQPGAPKPSPKCSNKLQTSIPSAFNIYCFSSYKSLPVSQHNIIIIEANILIQPEHNIIIIEAKVLIQPETILSWCVANESWKYQAGNINESWLC